MFKFLIFLILSNTCLSAQSDSLAFNSIQNDLINDTFSIYFDEEDEYLIVEACDTTLVLDNGLLNCLDISVENESVGEKYGILLIKTDSKNGVDTYSFIELFDDFEVDNRHESMSVEYHQQVKRVIEFKILENSTLEMGGELHLEPR